MIPSPLAAVSTSFPPSNVDRTRERELYKYYQPNDDGATASSQPETRSPPPDPNTLCVQPTASPDTILTALAQLTAIRLKASRAMISLIGKDTQYFIAEATKTLNLVDGSKSDEDGDGLWAGCSNVSKSGRLCEKTIELPPTPGGYPCFVVTDLSRDDRFKDLPFVTGSPFFRFYAGTPLTTRKGVNIGSLFILDDKVRPQLNEDQQTFLGTMADAVMRHMEMNREAEQRKKGILMSEGLNAFVEGKSRLAHEEPSHASSNNSNGTSKQHEITRKHNRSTTDRGTSPAAAPSHTRSDDDSIYDGPHLPSDDASGFSTPLEEHDLSSADPIDTLSQEGSDRGLHGPFMRAASLLQESLNLQDNGGVVFLDTVVGFRRQPDGASKSVPLSGEASANEDSESSYGQVPFLKRVEGRQNSIFDSASMFNSVLQHADETPADILGCSASADSLSPGDKIPDLKLFKPLGEMTLQTLLKRHPRGNLWSFDEDGTVSSSEDERALTTNRKLRSSRSEPKEAEARILQRHFPGARQLILSPLWDASKARWYSCCFCWTTSSRQVFTRDTELSFLVAFGNSVMAEVSRLATLTADKQKGDFIGSISHELRSPLHGILASAEFLGETVCDTFQNSLINTIESCGRTLLDTINHVLDFSKINSFERNWRRARKSRVGSQSKSLKESASNQAIRDSAPPLLNIYALTDVAAACEEVVEGVYAGQMYQDMTFNMADIVAGGQTKTQSDLRGGGDRPGLGELRAQGVGKPVEIVLDIEKGDYNFTTQPGALRRVIMNVFGNALKYTDEGVIHVKLELHDMKGARGEVIEDGKLLVIKVIDSGRGISSDYLRTRLYTSFAQENVLAPGTGLGLSIVRSITNMLGGSIDIQSQVGQGTKVEICLPLRRASGSDDFVSTPDVSTPSSGSSHEGSPDPSPSLLQERASGKSVALYGFDNDLKSAQTRTARTLRYYISTWYGMRALTTWVPSLPADIVVVDEKHVNALLAEDIGESRIVVLCSNASRYGSKGLQHEASRGMEFVSKPFGPYKLAKALDRCLKEIHPNGATVEPVKENFARDPINASETVAAELGEDVLGGQGSNAPLAVQTNGTGTAAMPTNGPMAKATLCVRRRSKVEEAEPLPLPSLPIHLTSEPTAVLSDKDSSGDLQQDLSSEPKRRRSPRILLVDDNKINLRLLETFMKKRKYKYVDSAENGQLAVQAMESQKRGYDIIFMDISMPVLNGFEATRAIRDIEASRRYSTSFDRPSSSSPYSSVSDTLIHASETKTPALVIALTGLASGDDQNEAFASGMNSFMTKPVSFKEVGRLLDYWEANGRWGTEQSMTPG